MREEIICPVCGNIKTFKNLNYEANPTEKKWKYNCFINKTLTQCLDCDFIFTKNKFEKNELNNFYYELYKDLEIKNFDPSNSYEYIPRNFSHVNFIKNNFNLKNGIDILEIGPNEHGMIATFNLYCKPNYFYFEQFDYPIIKEFGGKRVGNFFSKENVKQSNLKDLDLIVLGHSLEHFDPSTLKENISLFHEILGKNGHLSIEVPFGYKLKKTAPHTLFFNLKNLSLLLENMNFTVVSSQLMDTDNNLIETNDIKNKANSSNPNLKQTIINKLMYINCIRKLIIKALYVKYLINLTPLYDGRPYLRVLAKKA